MKLRRPPGPHGKPVAGVLFEFSRDPLRYLTECARTYGDMVFYSLAGNAVYQVNDPFVIEDILVNKHSAFSKDLITKRLGNVLGNGLLLSEGEFWRRQRRLAAPSLQRNAISSYASTMVSLAEGFVATLRSGEERDIHSDMMKLTLQIVAKTLFDADVSSTSERIGHALDVAMQEFQSWRGSWRRFLPDWANVMGRQKVAGAVADLDSIAHEMIRHRTTGSNVRTDLLSCLMAAKDEDGSTMTETQLRDEIVTMFLAGHETTALTLTYALYLLSEHPLIARQAFSEVDRVIRGAPTLEDVSELRFVDAIVRETLRLYPPAWAIGQQAQEDCQIGGFSVPRGSQVFLSQWVVHRDPRWFENAEDFQPERWLAHRSATLPRFAFFPFGGGPRICIGKHFAMMEAVLVLAVLLKRVEFRWALNDPIALVPSITLRPAHGARMKIRLREEHSVQRPLSTSIAEEPRV